MWMYVTAMLMIATSAMAEDHIKTNNIGLQCQTECCCEQEVRPPPPPPDQSKLCKSLKLIQSLRML